jgi:hypothetical protein
MASLFRSTCRIEDRVVCSIRLCNSVFEDSRSRLVRPTQAEVAFARSSTIERQTPFNQDIRLNGVYLQASAGCYRNLP